MFGVSKSKIVHGVFKVYSRFMSLILLKNVLESFGKIPEFHRRNKGGGGGAGGSLCKLNIRLSIEL